MATGIYAYEYFSSSAPQGYFLRASWRFNEIYQVHGGDVSAILRFSAAGSCFMAYSAFEAEDRSG